MSEGLGLVQCVARVDHFTTISAQFQVLFGCNRHNRDNCCQNHIGMDCCVSFAKPCQYTPAAKALFLLRMLHL